MKCDIALWKCGVRKVPEDLGVNEGVYKNCKCKPSEGEMGVMAGGFKVGGGL